MRHKARGDGESPLQAAIAATFELSGMTGTPHPRYRMTEMSAEKAGKLGWYREECLHPYLGVEAYFIGKINGGKT